jgi:SSS family transporter
MLDWLVLVGSLVYIIAYGLYRSRNVGTVRGYLLAGKSMPWFAMAFSIMATQASAITFISTTGQSYVDGMRFLQFYFGLPLAMIVLSMTAVPIFHRANVYTAYEYIGQRFDAKTRALVSVIFLIQRGLAVGVALYAPAIVLTVIFGWPDVWTTFIMGSLVVFYTTIGGIQAVTWTDVQQMAVMLLGLFAALVTAVWLLPSDVTLGGALTLAGAAGRLNAVTTSFDWNDRYNLWSGLIGGMFLALAYFGCDQSQVQRYLTGRSIAQSRISLLFNAVAKVPMQFFILLVGAIVFVFFTFEKPPLLFHPLDLQRIEGQSGFAAIQQKYDAAFQRRKDAAQRILGGAAEARGDFQAAQHDFDAARRDAMRLVEQTEGTSGASDANYIFLSFVTKYMPPGLVGLILAAIFAAAMSTISAEINSLATVTMIDVYKPYIRREASDRHYLIVSRLATVFWGGYAVVTAQYGKTLGALIETVNIVGSLFYGGLLGVFALAFFFPRVNGNAAFLAVLAGEAAIFAAHLFSPISFLWYNVIGALVVVGTGAGLSQVWRQARTART